MYDSLFNFEDFLFTADWHLFQENILKYRPEFKTVQDMHDCFIENYNSKASDSTVGLFVGDMTLLTSNKLPKLKPVMNALKGTKHLILGNHDEGKPLAYMNYGFNSVHTSYWFTLKTILAEFTSTGELSQMNDKLQCLVVHDPAIATVFPNALCIHGHVHTVFKTQIEPIKCYNVGVDVNNYYPVQLEEIVNTFFGKKFN